jgi:thioredoxin-dependent adenylylsulfate APS reductase
VEALSASFEGQDPRVILRWALETFGSRLAISTSFQMDGMALLDMAWRIDPSVRVFTIDTGRLPQETYDLMDRVRERYGLEVEVYFPDALDVEEMVRAHGVNLFYRGVPERMTCCDVRKVRPLLRVLQHLDAWITGLRRDQSVTRATIRPVDVDRDHGGIVKVSPLAAWTASQVREYIRAHDVPTHALYGQGYTSIGCAPCTRPATNGDDRSGRWWWEVDAPKECGMHCGLESGGLKRRVELARPPVGG